MWQLLHWAWYSLTPVWIIFPLVPAWFPVVLTIHWRPRPRWMYKYQSQIIQCVLSPTNRVGDPSLSQAMISTHMLSSSQMKCPCDKVWDPSLIKARNNLLQCVQKCYLHRTIMLISVLHIKIKIIQASSGIQSLLHLCVLTRTVNLPNVSICSQWS